MYLILRVVAVAVLCASAALAGEGEPSYDGVASTEEKVERTPSRQSGTSELSRQLQTALPRAGMDDSASVARVQAAMADLTGAFGIDSRVRSAGWRLIRVRDVDGFGARVQVRGQGLKIADFALLEADVREGRVLELPAVRIVLRAEGVSSTDARVWYCAPGGELEVPVSDDASHRWLDAEFTAAGFVPLREGGQPGVFRCRAPEGRTGLLVVDATTSSQVWTAGGLSARDGAIQYEQRIVVYEGNVPRHFRGVVEGKVNEAITAKFRDAIARMVSQVPGQFTFQVDKVSLDRGNIEVSGKAFGETSKREQGSFGRDFSRDRSQPDYEK